MPSTRRRRAAFSQNFLHSRRLVSELVARSSIDRDDVVVEIGPGKGIITDVLAERSRHVITIEKDPRYAAHVSQRFGGRPNVTVFSGDILEFPLPETPFKVFANIPYRITAAIIERLTTGVSPPTDAYLTVQAEAAARFVGQGGASMVSTCLEPYFEISVEHRFRRRDFVPRPEVDSVLLRILKRDEPIIPWEVRHRYRHLVEAVYSAWQPTVAKALRSMLPKPVWMKMRSQCAASLDVRPSQLPLESWVALFDVITVIDDERVWGVLFSASERLRRQQQDLQRPTRTPSAQRSKRRRVPARR